MTTHTQIDVTQQKAVLRGKFIALNAYIKKLEKSHTSQLIEHLKTLKQREENSSRRTRWQKIIKLRAEINKIETKKTIQRINKQRVGSSRKPTKETNLQPN